VPLSVGLWFFGLTAWSSRYAHDNAENNTGYPPATTIF